MGLVKTRRLAAMHPPSRDALRRTGKMQRSKFGKMPSWREVKDWRGKIVGVCNYKAHERTGHESWDEDVNVTFSLRRRFQVTW